MATRAAPAWLQAFLLAHRHLHAPTYGGFLSDHLPMAALAMWHFGHSEDSIRRWAAGYTKQLDTAPDLHYLELCTQIDSEIEHRGTTMVLQQRLPELLSGWVQDAFHPLIRIAFGRRFQCPGEVSAGLAYLAQVGADPMLANYAASARPGSQVRWPSAVPTAASTFTRRVTIFLSSKPTEPTLLGPQTMNAYALAALRVMLSTQHFFALHLLTAADAFRVVTAGLRGIPDSLFAAGLMAGYAAAGPLSAATNAQFDAAEAFHTDLEHDYKVALSCLEWAEVTQHPLFQQAAHNFIDQLQVEG
ncbi:MAG: hypothetical protein ACR2PZ_04835 [Pseudomonadales bacterium]